MLDAAHRGYDYQDLLIATRLTDVLLGNLVDVRVDEKLVPADLFDDLTTVDLDHRRARTQFKHKDNADLPLPLSTFTGDKRDLRLDRLVASAVADREGPGNAATSLTFRIVLRDARPTDEPLIRVLRAAEPDPGPFVPGMRSLRLRFDPDALWPLDDERADDQSVVDAFAFLRDGRIAREDLLWTCERLIVEVEAPAASFDLINPGPAERLLLERMRRDIGAESYPNRDRSATDVAEAMIGTARAARLRRATASTEELLRRTRLRHDFGAVARAHPVDPTVEVHRPTTVTDVVRRAEAAAGGGRALLLVGPPGQGKSWACHQVVDALNTSGWLVAEHYCFLGDADFEREARVLGEAVFGSLLGRLAEAEPTLVTQQRPRFAADETSLAEAVRRARENQPNRRVALVVDGIDHVTRVRGATTRRADPSRTLAEELAALDLPVGSVLIVLSQPGEHLRPLQDAGALLVMVPAFGSEELRLLAERLGARRLAGGTAHSFNAADGPKGLVDADDQDAAADFLAALEERSAGNALYATYLCREALRLPVASVDPAGVIRSLPPFDGTLEAYYDHLVAALDDGAAWVADVVALLDFAVTRAELREIMPEAGHRVDAALNRLAPVLVERAAQGGVRVYHESFARFLRRPFRDDPAAIASLLGRVASWLASKGMFTDARAFRFLLPTLARAGRDREVVDQVGVDFATRAVAGGFTASAIAINLGTAIGCAARLGAWPAVVRCVELARAAETYENERLDSQVVEFADVPMALLGTVAFADRLLYDGRTTMPARAGLQLCAAVDAEGVAAPWREYIDAFISETESDNTDYGPESDCQVSLALLRGQLRLTTKPQLTSDEGVSAASMPGTTTTSAVLANPPVELDRVAGWIEERELPARPVIDAVCDTLGVRVAEELVARLKKANEFALVLAERLTSCEDDVPPDTTRQWVTAASRDPVAGTSHRLLALGVPTAALAHLQVPAAREQLFVLAHGVQESKAHLEPASIAVWLDACAIAARRDPLGLATAEALIAGPGWYRCWLRFTAALCRAEVQPVGQQGPAALDALQLLTVDLRPFVGDPRACDLYRLHGLIASTVRRAVSLLDDDSWPAAIDTLRRVSDSISVTLRGELGGPLPLDLLIGLIIGATTPARRPVSEAFVTSVLTDRGSGRYYSDLAGFHLAAARLSLAANARDAAAAQWQHACRMLTAYGWRKDATIYELLDPFPALITADQIRARERIAAVQPLCERIPLHTDGKGTRHAPARWWQILASADPEALAELVTPALLRDCNMPNSRLEEARVDLWRAHHARADPFIAATLRLTIDPALETDDPDALTRLAATAHTDSTVATLLRLLLARADERPTRYPFSNSDDLLRRDNEQVDRLNAIAERAGAPYVLPAVVDEMSQRASAARPAGLDTNRRTIPDRLNDSVIEVFGPGTVGLGRAIRAWRQRSHNAAEPRWASARFANAIGYRLIELVDQGRTDDAEAALRTLADSMRFGDEEGLLSALAEGLEARGYTRLAVVAHTFTWTRSRGNGGWLTFGGETALNSLRRAAALDPAAALGIVADEVQRIVRGNRYGSYGVSRALIYAFAAVNFGRRDDQAPVATWPDTAFSAWDEAAAVITVRAPRVGPNDDPVYPYTAPVRNEDHPDCGPCQEDSSSATRPSDSSGLTTDRIGSLNAAEQAHRRSIDVALATATLAGLAHPAREQKRRTLVAVKLLVAERSELVTDAIKLTLENLAEPATLSWLLRVLETSGPAAHNVIRRCAPQLRAGCQAPHLLVRALARRLLTSIGLDADPPPISDPGPTLVRAVNGGLTMPTIANEAIREALDEGWADTGDSDASTIDHISTDKAAKFVDEVAGTRIQQGERLMPGLRRAVVIRVAGTLSDEAQKSRLKHQLDSLSSSADPHWPNAFLGTEEIVEDALQRVAAGGRTLLAVTGNLVRDPITWEDKLAGLLLNDPRLPLALEAVREPRPAMPAPPGRGADVWRAVRDATVGVSSSAGRKVLLGATDHGGFLSATVNLNAGAAVPVADAGPYRGWRVLASAEQRTVTSDGWPRGPDAHAFRYCAVELRELGDKDALHLPPFADGDAKLWWVPLPNTPAHITLRGSAPLIGIDSGSSAIGAGSAGLGWSCSILVPSAVIVAALGLRPGTEPLQLIDDRGAAIVLRTWRSRYYGSEYELSRPLLCGAQLLVRPDVFTRLLNLAPTNLAWREHVGGDAVLAR